MKKTEMRDKRMKRSMRRCLILGLGVLVMAAGALAVFTSGNDKGQNSGAQLQLSPPNPEFIRYLRDRESGKPWATMTADGYSLGLIPAPMDLSHVKSDPESSFADRLPTSYDLRTKNKLTPVKDQGSVGTCWTFATFGSLESFLKPGAIWDFSEQNLADHHGFDYGINDGGHMWMSAAYLARWSGPLNETDDPYIYYSIDGAATPKKHVQNIMFMPVRTSPTDNTNIKNAVMTYGAVSVSMAWDSNSWNSATNSYYYNGSNWVGGHAVCIVGWNDSYPSTEFKSQPPGNGAFIVKNSWGSGWGEQGYFYVSYYDSKFARVNTNAVAKGESPNNYRSNYGYDPLGWVGSMWENASNKPMAWFSNIFTATVNGNLAAVSFYTGAKSNPYEIYVYTGVSAKKPRSGILKKTKKATLASPGYFTIPLGSLVPLKKGQKFSIVVKLTTKGYNYPIPVEYAVSGYSSQAKASAGQSFISANGTTWVDLTTKSGLKSGNVCLRGFTKY